MQGRPILSLAQSWIHGRRWKGIRRTYEASDVLKLRGSLLPTYAIASRGCESLWRMLHDEPYLRALGVGTGTQAVQLVRAGAAAMYVSAAQVAADANDAETMYPDYGLYPSSSMPRVVRRISSALRRADQIQSCAGSDGISWFVPVVAEAASSGGNPLATYETAQALIESGAGALAFDDQDPNARRYDHAGGKILVPASVFVQRLTAARLASDVMGVGTVIIARTDARAARSVSNDVDPVDQAFIAGHRADSGYFNIRGGPELAITRALVYAPYADILSFESPVPDVDEALAFAAAVHAEYPGKILAYDCSGVASVGSDADDRSISLLQNKLALAGYKFQYLPDAGFHSINASMFQLAQGFAREGLHSYAQLQRTESMMQRDTGYQGSRPHMLAGSAYFDTVLRAVQGSEVPADSVGEVGEERQDIGPGDQGNGKAV